MMFRAIDFTRRMPSAKRFQARANAINDFIDQTAAKYGAVVVDLHSARVFNDARLWAKDRIHMTQRGPPPRSRSSPGSPGTPTPPSTGAPPSSPPQDEPRPVAKTWSDLRWLVGFLLPWIKHHLTGRSSGNSILPRAPT